MPSSGSSSSSDSRSHPRLGFVLDAACDVPASERGENWIVLPESLSWAGRHLIDDGSASQGLYEAALDGRPVEVHPPSTEAFAEAFDALAGCDRIFAVLGSSAVSRSAEFASAAAAGNDAVRVIECSLTGMAVGLVAARLHALALGGMELEQLDEYAHQQATAVRFVLVPDALIPHGRQRPSALMLLAGHRIVSDEGGSLSAQGRVRTRRATLTELQRYLSTRSPVDRPVRVAIGHADAAGAVDPVIDVLERARPNATIELVARVGPRLVRQLGGRCVGVAWLAE